MDSFNSNDFNQPNDNNVFGNDVNNTFNNPPNPDNPFMNNFSNFSNSNPQDFNSTPSPDPKHEEDEDQVFPESDTIQQNILWYLSIPISVISYSLAMYFSSFNFPALDIPPNIIMKLLEITTFFLFIIGMVNVYCSANKGIHFFSSIFEINILSSINGKSFVIFNFVVCSILKSLYIFIFANAKYAVVFKEITYLYVAFGVCLLHIWILGQLINYSFVYKFENSILNTVISGFIGSVAVLIVGWITYLYISKNGFNIWALLLCFIFLLYLAKLTAFVICYQRNIKIRLNISLFLLPTIIFSIWECLLIANEIEYSYLNGLITANSQVNTSTNSTTTGK